MNRHLAIATTVAATAVASIALAQAPAQPGMRPVTPTAPGTPAAPAAAPRAATPATHVAVIDVGYIFKNHTRFKAAMEKMKDEVLAAENALKAERDRIQGLMEQLKGFVVGSTEYRNLEAEVAKAQGEFNVNAQLQKKDFMDREAKVYMQVYAEIERAVSQFARQHGIAVVQRIDGEPVDSSDRNRILGNITKPTVYFDPQVDITQDILRMLNAAPVAGVTDPQPPR